jgi:hypothetical protein
MSGADGGGQWTPEMAAGVLAEALGVSGEAAVVEAEELRERLKASFAARTGPVGMDCPVCGRPAAAWIEGGQAFCDASGCQMFAWDPGMTFEEMAAARVAVVDLGGAP